MLLTPSVLRIRDENEASGHEAAFLLRPSNTVSKHRNMYMLNILCSIFNRWFRRCYSNKLYPWIIFKQEQKIILKCYKAIQNQYHHLLTLNLQISNRTFVLIQHLKRCIAMHYLHTFKTNLISVNPYYFKNQWTFCFWRTYIYVKPLGNK